MSDVVRSTWGEYAPRFVSEGRASEDRESLRKLLELTAPANGSRVLDVATGAGYTGFVFARNGCDVVLSDPTHEMLLAARSGWSERGLPHYATLVEAWAEALPFGDAAFDLVVSHRAPHQFADRPAFLREARRILKAGGLLGVADQSPPDGFEDWHNDLERLRDPTHEHALSPRQWRALVDDSGLRWERTDVVYQEHDVEDWMDRVDCPQERRAPIRERLASIPDGLRDIVRPERRDGRLWMRTPQCVFIARR